MAKEKKPDVKKSKTPKQPVICDECGRRKVRHTIANNRRVCHNCWKAIRL